MCDGEMRLHVAKPRIDSYEISNLMMQNTPLYLLNIILLTLKGKRCIETNSLLPLITAPVYHLFLGYSFYKVTGLGNPVWTGIIHVLTEYLEH